MRGLLLLLLLQTLLYLSLHCHQRDTSSDAELQWSYCSASIRQQLLRQWKRAGWRISNALQHRWVCLIHTPTRCTLNPRVLILLQH
jgi:hypothetical protein